MFHSYCRVCTKINKEKSYAKHRTRYIANAKIRNKIARKRNYEFIEAYLKGKKCIDCGNPDRELLEFDHVDPKLKEFTISKAVRSFYSVARIAKELKKCEIRCCNCHRKRTARQFNWFKKY